MSVSDKARQMLAASFHDVTHMLLEEGLTFLEATSCIATECQNFDNTFVSCLSDLQDAKAIEVEDFNYLYELNLNTALNEHDLHHLVETTTAITDMSEMIIQSVDDRDSDFSREEIESSIGDFLSELDEINALAVDGNPAGAWDSMKMNDISGVRVNSMYPDEVSAWSYVDNNWTTDSSPHMIVHKSDDPVFAQFVGIDPGVTKKELNSNYGSLSSALYAGGYTMEDILDDTYEEVQSTSSFDQVNVKRLLNKLETDIGKALTNLVFKDNTENSVLEYCKSYLGAIYPDGYHINEVDLNSDNPSIHITPIPAVENINFTLTLAEKLGLTEDYDGSEGSYTNCAEMDGNSYMDEKTGIVRVYDEKSHSWIDASKRDHLDDLTTRTDGATYTDPTSFRTYCWDSHVHTWLEVPYEDRSKVGLVDEILGDRKFNDHVEGEPSVGATNCFLNGVIAKYGEQAWNNGPWFMDGNYHFPLTGRVGPVKPTGGEHYFGDSIGAFINSEGIHPDAESSVDLADALVERINSAPTRQIHYIDVESMDPDVAKKFVDDFAKKIIGVPTMADNAPKEQSDILHDRTNKLLNNTREYLSTSKRTTKIVLPIILRA